MLENRVPHDRPNFTLEEMDRHSVFHPLTSIATHMEKGPGINDMTPRQILDAVTRALDRVARRIAEQKAGRTSGHARHQPIE